MYPTAHQGSNIGLLLEFPQQGYSNPHCSWKYTIDVIVRLVSRSRYGGSTSSEAESQVEDFPEEHGGVWRDPRRRLPLNARPLVLVVGSLASFESRTIYTT